MCIRLVLYLASLAMFAYQGKSIIQKYNQNEKIVDIQVSVSFIVCKVHDAVQCNFQLVFDAAPFPAITLCNLNPYKKTLAQDVDLVKRTLKVFQDVMNEAAAKTHHTIGLFVSAKTT